MDSEEYFNQVFSRENVLKSKPPSRIARTLLFQIENRSAYLAEKSRQEADLFLTEETIEERQMRYFSAFYSGEDPPQPATIQDIERFATRWQDLVSSNPDVQAAVAHHLGQKYQFNAPSVPHIRHVLGLDTDAVQTAYERFYDQDLQSIYAEQQKFLERLRWTWSGLGQKIQNLPPFWWVFSLTITNTVGSSILALPIALAGIGPLPGILLLIIFGLINVLTMGYMAETASRSAGIRSGNAFLGQVVGDYLGRPASITLSLALLAKLFLTLISFYIGFSTTIAGPTGIPAPIWMVILFLVCLFFLIKGSLSSTVTSALVVGTINMAILLVMVLLSLPFVQFDYLTYSNLPFISGGTFDPSVLALVFGIVISAYFGHLSIPNSARMILLRDPSGKSLLRGAMTAQVAAILINSIWILVLNGSLAPETLANETGTVIIPLAAQVGPIVVPFGTLYILLGIGMITIHFTVGLFNLTREWLPHRQKSPVSLRRRQGRLIFHPPREKTRLPQISLVFLGLREKIPMLRLDVQASGQTSRYELQVENAWDFSSYFSQHPYLALQEENLDIRLEIVNTQEQFLQFRIISPLTMKFEPGWDAAGMKMSAILTLPEPQARLMTQMVRGGRIGLQMAAQLLSQTPTAAEKTLNDLMNRGYIQMTDQGKQYEPILAASQEQGVSEEIITAVSGNEEGTSAASAAVVPSGSPAMTSRFLDKAFGERGRFILGLLPIITVFLIAQAAFLTGQGSFTAPLSFIGVLTVAELSAIFPVLLLRSGRRKGEIIPNFIYAIIGHPAFLIIIYVISLAAIILHGLFIWQNPIQRGLALIVAAILIIITFDAWRRGAFRPRLVVEVHRDSKEKLHFSVALGGRPQPVDVQWSYESGPDQSVAGALGSGTTSDLRAISFWLPPLPAHHLKVWAYEETVVGDYEILPATAELCRGDERESVNLALSGGEKLWPSSDHSSQLTLTFHM